MARTGTIALLMALLALPATAPPASAAPPGPVFRDGEAQPVFDPKDVITQEIYVRVPVDSDGDGRDDEVHATVVRPRATDQGLRVPAVYEMSPYYAGGNAVDNHDVDVELHVPEPAAHGTPAGRVGLLGPNSLAIGSGYATYFLARGFAVISADSLGTGGSTGCPTTGGRNETAGARSVVDWLNGRTTAHDAAGAPVTAAWSTGLVGMMGTSYNGTLPNAVAATGVPGLAAIVPISAISSWYDYYRSNGLVVAPGGYQGEDADVLARYVYTRADQEICRPVLDRIGVDQDRVSGDRNAFWDERDYLPDAGEVHAAVLAAHGLHDWNVKTGQLARWYAALRAHGVPHQLWLHQYGHLDPVALRHDEWLHALNRWFTRYLWGEQNGVEQLPKVTLQREDHSWVTESDWPVPDAADTALRPWPGGGSIGALRPEGVPGAATVEQFVDDASRTAQQLVDATSSGNRLSYATGPTRAPLRLSGTPQVTMSIALDRAAANLTALLVDRAPDGTAVIVTRGWIDPQNRTDPSTTVPVRPGERFTLVVDLQPVDYVVPAGHRMGLVLAASDHDFTLRPRPGTAVAVDLTGTELTLPVVGGTDTVRTAIG